MSIPNYVELPFPYIITGIKSSLSKAARTILLFGTVVQVHKTTEKIAYMEIPSSLDAAQLRQKKSNGMLGEEWAIDSTLEAMIEFAASV